MSENGGVLEVSLTKFDMDAEASAASPEIEPGPYLRLRVSDTGHGMTPEILQRVFDPYFTTKEPGKGTGLGLAVVHGIVKSYGGGVTVSSEPGRGTTFDIYFPKIEPIKAPLEAEELNLFPSADTSAFSLLMMRRPLWRSARRSSSTWDTRWW